MTRKDYVVLAAALYQASQDSSGLVTIPADMPPHVAFDQGVYQAAVRIAAALKAENPRFDTVRFFDAVAGGE